jgi:hypothetical protein
LLGDLAPLKGAPVRLADVRDAAARDGWRGRLRPGAGLFNADDNVVRPHTLITGALATGIRRRPFLTRDHIAPTR